MRLSNPPDAKGKGGKSAKGGKGKDKDEGGVYGLIGKFWKRD